MYGDGWVEHIGKMVKIINHIFRDGCITYRTPQHLVGKIGKLTVVFDHRYDTSYPTGHETITLIVEIDGKEHELESFFCQKL